MIQSTLYGELNNSLCEAVGCVAEATITIEVKAGQRIIPLHLCTKCVQKFEDSATDQHIVDQSLKIRMQEK